MPTYGTVKYHNYFSKRFVKYMKSLGFKESKLYDMKIMKNEFSEKYVDIVPAVPTVAVPNRPGETRIGMKFGHSYMRQYIAIENECRALLDGVAGVNNVYTTIMTSLDREVCLSKEGADELLYLWIHEFYPKILNEFLIFEDLNNLNVLFNYPKISKERGYDKIVSIDNVGIRGEVRSLLIAKAVKDDIFIAKKEKYLLHYNNVLVECNEKNNRVVLPVLAQSKVASINVVTDALNYGPDDTVLVQGELINTSVIPGEFIAVLQIEDLNSVLIKKFSQHESGLIVGNGVFNLSDTWNTARYQAGQYLAHALLYSLEGTLIDEASYKFAISNSATGNTPQATLRLTLDKPVYNTSDQISLGSLSHNITANVLIQAATVKIKILKPDGSLYAELEQTVGDLASGNLLQLNSLQALNSVGIGSYSVTAELFDADQTVLATAQTQFDVAEQRSLTISGQVAVAQQSIFAGAPQQCLNTINNNGSISCVLSKFLTAFITFFL